ncbi:alcohol dehydrogenase catalytic domain-containing protein [Frankia sp. CiP3]|uniref:alcohol dehydrogenase catalytic domain-containing protein n=1 Tax=Frankia sp. CiP3 TaxID=2880971 RepID=UPI001EF61C29|nr:alcohol dehydrogenase catalytic domain-containing protein [Frankia sp. CiP3]
MRTRAAVLWPGEPQWSIDEITLDPPGVGEVLVRMVATGLCHSDDHLRRGGYPEIRLPIIGGHEGAGVVEAVGPGVRRIRVCDHVVLSVPLPPCGDCAPCLDGRPYFCERGALLGQGFQVSDGTARHHARGQDLGVFVFLGTFAEHTVVSEKNCVRVEPGLPLELACTIGCAGVTGWGAVLNTAEVRPGDVVVVAGVGGIGANAVQAACFAGARAVVAVDPVPFKRQIAMKLGATLTATTLDDALPAVRDLTHGRMANTVVMTMAAGDGRLLESALSLVGKRGRVVVVNVHPAEETAATISLRNLQSFEKQVVGCLAGSWDGRKGIAFLADLHHAGRYDLDSIVTRTYDSLADVTTGYHDQAAGTIVRGVVRLSA